MRPAQKLRAENGGVDGEALGGVGGVVSREGLDPVEPVGDGAHGQVQSPRRRGGDATRGEVGVEGLEEGLSATAGVHQLAQNRLHQIGDGGLVAVEGGWTSFGSTNNNGTDVLVKDMAAGTVANEHKDSLGANGGSGAGSPAISSSTVRPTVPARRNDATR